MANCEAGPMLAAQKGSYEVHVFPQYSTIENAINIQKSQKHVPKVPQQYLHCHSIRLPLKGHRVWEKGFIIKPCAHL